MSTAELEILIATQNPGKVREYETLLRDLPVRLLSLADVGLGDMDVEENGSSFAENARIKSLAYAETSGKLTLADDSGLCVDALDGAPGIYSARYGGMKDDAGRRRYLLQKLIDVPEDQRQAHFVCVIALSDPATDIVETVEGRCNGRILLAEQDDGHGFGYDPLFLPDGHDRTFAQIPKAEKNTISHRGRATQALIPVLSVWLNEKHNAEGKRSRGTEN